MPGKAKSVPQSESLLHLPDAASQLGISVPTIKQWIYKKKIRSIRTTGGHHRIPQSGVGPPALQNSRQDGGRTQPQHEPRQRTQSTGGTNRFTSHQRIDGGGGSFHWQPEDHVHHHRALRPRDAAQAGPDRCRPDQVHGSDDPASLTRGRMSTWWPTSAFLWRMWGRRGSSFRPPVCFSPPHSLSLNL